MRHHWTFNVSWLTLLVASMGCGSGYSQTLTIRSPLPGERFVTHETVTFKVDVKDRHFDSSQIVWTSNVSSVLGKGPEIKVSSLPGGLHQITASANGETQEVRIRVFKDLWDLYRATPSQGEIDRIRKDFTVNWIDGAERDEKWAAWDPPAFNQESLAPSKVVLFARLDVLRHQVFSEPLPFGDQLRAYDHLRKYVKTFNLRLGCDDSAGGNGQIFLGRWQNSWDLPHGDCKSLASSGPLRGYVGALALLMHEERHSEPGSPIHATCYAFSNMDPSLDKGSGHAWALLYAMWVYKYGVYDPPVMKQEARIFAYTTLARFCSKPTSSNAKVQAIVDELIGDSAVKPTVAAASPLLPAPRLLLPDAGAVLNDPKKITNLTWEPVPSAAAYVLEWDYAWTAKEGLVWQSEQPGFSRDDVKTQGWWFRSHRRLLGEVPTSQTAYSLHFVGAQPGRWRVWAVDAEDNPGNKSEWREFRYSR
jgi:hypothetical protein